MSEKVHDLSILVIDNFQKYAPAMRENLERSVNKTVQVVVEPNVKTALHKLSQQRFDIVLASMALIKKDGLLPGLHRQKSHPPVVGIMDHATPPTTEACSLTDFLVKEPAHPEAWSKVILNTIERENLKHSLHNSEKDLRKVIEQNADAIIIIDRAGVILYMNASARLMFERMSCGDMFGHPLTAGDTTEVDILRKNGDRMVAEMRLVEIEWGGEPACLASLRDVTQRKLTEEQLESKVNERTAELRTLNEELRRLYESANQAALHRSRFIANFSHEVRTPLAAIVSSAELLPLADDLDEFKELAAHVSYGSQNLLALVQSILDFSKLESGAVPVNKTEVSMPELIASVERSAGIFATKSGTTITTHIDEAIPSLVRTDGVKVQQVLMNLVSNAVKFSPKGKVSIKAEYSEADGARVIKLTVADSGIGMNAAECETVFQPFVQANDTIHQAYGGTGLGLAICKQIVSVLGGTINFCSEKDKGSTFWFSFPVDPSELMS